jgi:hypothetical protein
MRKLLLGAAAALAAFAVPTASPVEAQSSVRVSDMGATVHLANHRDWRDDRWRGDRRWRNDDRRWRHDDRRWRDRRWRHHGWRWRAPPPHHWGWSWSRPCRGYWWDGWSWRCRW